MPEAHTRLTKKFCTFFPVNFHLKVPIFKREMSIIHHIPHFWIPMLNVSVDILNTSVVAQFTVCVYVELCTLGQECCLGYQFPALTALGMRMVVLVYISCHFAHFLHVQSESNEAKDCN